MNKKLFLSMFAAAGMLFATSCSNDELETVHSGDKAQVTFSLAAEGGIATRAISDGKNANLLYYAIFDADGHLITNIEGSTNGLFEKKNAFPAGSKKDEVEVTLAKGQKYTAVFWAQNASCNAYKVTAETDGLKVAVDYKDDKNDNNNDETRDAFFKADTFTVTGNTEISVFLKRPFAQINVGVTQADWDAAVRSGVDITESKVVIKNAATSINLLDGTVSGEEEVTYDFATIPEKFNPVETLEVDVNRDGTIQEDENYVYLSMSYILTSAERTTLDGLQFTFSPASGEDIVFDEGLHAVPVQRNWRTNILGKLLTGDIQFNIEIDQEFDDNYNFMYPDKDDNSMISVTTAEEITNAIKNATSDITLYFANDITGNVNVEQKKDIDVIVNGNNYEFDGVITLKSTCGQSGASLKIQNLNFVTTSTTDFDFISSNVSNSNTHDLTISNCTFTGKGTGDIVALRMRHGKNITFENCTATGLHSLMWATGTRNIKVSGVELTDCKNGVHFGTATGHVIENSTIKTIGEYGYGVRVDAATSEPQSSLTVKNCTLEGDAPVLVRKSIANTQYALNFEGNNTLITSKAYHIITTATDYAAGTELTGNAGTVNITGADDYLVYPRDLVVCTVEELAQALKNGGEKTIYLGNDITVDAAWDSRNTGKATKPVSINGLNHTIKITGTIDDKNYNTVFRFEDKAELMNLTFDLSNAQGNKIKAISAKTELSVENCEFIGNSTNGRYAIIFGEGSSGKKQDYAATVTGCTFKDWNRGITDNQNALDYKTVTVEKNVFNNAHVTLSAYESVTFTGNELVSSAINITSYTSASTAKVKATGNIIDMNQGEANKIGNLGQQHFFTPANVEAQSGINVITGTNN